ncbi:MAG: hypothetical protein HXY22_03560 [Alphaproteobacteria bacterium]|nr:hypothetical protein [Alphaproteobacteria bacterium]
MVMVQAAAFGPQKGAKSQLMVALITAAQLTLPVLFFAGIAVLIVWRSDHAIHEIDRFFRLRSADTLPSTWLTQAHLLLPLLSFAVILCNRRYGLGHATLQILFGIGLGIAAVVGIERVEPQILPDFTWPAWRLSASFFGALVLSLLLGAVVFDMTRGVRWWQAPFYSGIAFALIAAGVFYPAAHAGLHEHWLDQMVLHGLAMMIAAILFLIPYYLIRPLIVPMPGFGGR